MGIVTKAIGTASRNYSTMQAWEDALPANLVTDGNSQVGECYNDSEFIGSLLISGVTTDATHTITLTTAAGQSFRDHANAATNPLRYDASKGVGIKRTSAYGIAVQVDVDYVTIGNIQINNAGGGSGSRGLSAGISGNTHNVFRNLIVQASGAQYIATVRSGLFVNSAVIATAGGSSHGVNVDYASGVTLANLTIVAPSDSASSGNALTSSAAGAIVKNCAMFGFAASAGAAAHFSGNNNASDKPIGFGTANQASLTYANQIVGTTAAAIDASPKSGGALSTSGARDAANTADLDIIGAARSTSTPTIGAREFAAAGGSTRTGTLAATLGALSGSSTGAAQVSGASAKALEGATLAAAGTVTSSGQAAITLAGMSPAVAGAVDVHALTAGQLGGASLAASGTVSTGASATKTLAALSVVASGAVAAQGAAAATLGALALVASGSTSGAPQSITGTLSATLAPLTASSGASDAVAGAAAGQIAGCTLAAVGAVAIGGQVAATLGVLTLVAFGGALTNAVAQIVLNDMTLAATAGGINFTRSDRRTYRFPAENRRYVFRRENRRYNFAQ